MLSYSVSQTKWRITTEAENSARGSAFVFAMEIVTDGIAGEFAQQGRVLHGQIGRTMQHPTRRKKPCPLPYPKLPSRRMSVPDSIAVRKEQTQNQPPASPAAGSPDILRSTLA